MLELAIILGSILMVLLLIKKFSEYQVKAIAKKTCNLQQEASKKIQRLKKIEDLTKEKLLTMSYTEQVAKFISDGIVVADKEKILYVNPAVSKITGYSVEELTNKKWTDLIIEGNKDLAETSSIKTIEIDGVFHFLNKWKCKNGKVVTLWWTSTSFDENGICYAICRDVSRENGKKQKIDKLIMELLGANYEGDIGTIIEKVSKENGNGGWSNNIWSKSGNE